MRHEILVALAEKYRALINNHKVNVEIHLSNVTGVAEHIDHLETVEKELEKMAHYRDLLEETEKLLNEQPQFLS
jgi:hypothetical protein